MAYMKRNEEVDSRIKELLMTLNDAAGLITAYMAEGQFDEAQAVLGDFSDGIDSIENAVFEQGTQKAEAYDNLLTAVSLSYAAAINRRTHEDNLLEDAMEIWQAHILAILQNT